MHVPSGLDGLFRTDPKHRAHAENEPRPGMTTGHSPMVKLEELHSQLGSHFVSQDPHRLQRRRVNLVHSSVS